MDIYTSKHTRNPAHALNCIETGEEQSSFRLQLHSPYMAYCATVDIDTFRLMQCSVKELENKFLPPQCYDLYAVCTPLYYSAVLVLPLQHFCSQGRMQCVLQKQSGHDVNVVQNGNCTWCYCAPYELRLRSQADLLLAVHIDKALREYQMKSTVRIAYMLDNLVANALKDCVNCSFDNRTIGK